MARDTWLPARGPGDTAFERTFRLRPELYDGYEALRREIVRESGLDEALVARCAARVAWLLTAAGEPPAPVGEGDRAVFAFVDKFVRDPHAVTDADVAALRATLSPAEVVGLTETTALLDGFTRFRLILAGAEA